MEAFGLGARREASAAAPRVRERRGGTNWARSSLLQARGGVACTHKSQRGQRAQPGRSGRAPVGGCHGARSAHGVTSWRGPTAGAALVRCVASDADAVRQTTQPK